MTYVCSVSQVRTAEDCLRKWGFDKLDRVPRIPHPSAALGSAVHASLEAYLRDGSPLDLLTLPGRIAMAGVHLLPAPPFLIEHRLDVELDGVPFVGFIDVLSPGVVHDHKTTGDLRWCLTVDELQGDTQAAFYTHSTGSEEAHWIYYRTREPHKALDVRAKVDKMRQEDRIAQTVATARTLRSLALAPPPKGAIELPPNPDACDRYGGCPHKASGRCAGEFSDTERMRSFMSTASMLDQLAQRVNPPAAPAPGPSAAAPPVDDLPPLLQDGTRNPPPGIFWCRGGAGWTLAPESMRAILDPDGSKCWPQPTFTKLEGIQIEPTLPADPVLDAAVSERSPLASVLESAASADAPAADPLDALLAGAAPKARKARAPKAKAGADEGPDLDPRVKVLRDPDALHAQVVKGEIAVGPTAGLESDEPVETSSLRAVLDRFDLPGAVSGRTSSADPGASLRAAILARAVALTTNASADELLSLASIAERLRG